MRTDALLAEVQGHASKVTDADKAMVSRVEAWLPNHSGAYEGDFVADSLRAEGAFAATMARPMVYLRGPLDSFVRTGIAGIAESTFRDALVLCLLARQP